MFPYLDELARILNQGGPTNKKSHIYNMSTYSIPLIENRFPNTTHKHTFILYNKDMDQ